MTHKENITAILECYFAGFKKEIIDSACNRILEQESKTGWNNHQIACMLADLFGDACACNYNGIDEWLPELCDFKDTCCPKPVGVACWEQFLKHSKARYPIGADMRGDAE